MRGEARESGGRDRSGYLGGLGEGYLGWCGVGGEESEGERERERERENLIVPCIRAQSAPNL